MTTIIVEITVWGTDVQVTGIVKMIGKDPRVAEVKAH